jgi:hypothetical protein
MQQNPNVDIDWFLEVIASRARVGWQPYVLMLSRDGIPETILVGRREQTRLKIKVGYAEFLKPRVRALTFIYGGLIGNISAENCDALALEVVKTLRGGQADLAFFNHLRADGAFYSALSQAATCLTRDRFPTLQTHRSLALAGSVDEFWQGLSSKVRKNQRWQSRKLHDAFGGSVHIRCFKDGAELGSAFQEIEQIAKKTYQRALGVGFADDAETRSLMSFKAAKGWLRIFVLYLAGRPAAFWVGTAYRETFHSDLMGYDPEYGKYSPGMYLVLQVIEGFHRSEAERAIQSVDFGLGDAQYKEVLGNRSWQDASVYLFAPHGRGWMLNAIRTPLVWGDKTARWALERARLLQFAKSTWRHVVTKDRPKSADGRE